MLLLYQGVGVVGKVEEVRDKKRVIVNMEVKEKAESGLMKLLNIKVKKERKWIFNVQILQKVTSMMIILQFDNCKIMVFTIDHQLYTLFF